MGITLLANYYFSGIAPEGLSYVYHPEFIYKGERIINDLEDFDYNPCYVEVSVSGDSFRLDLDLADEDLVAEYKDNEFDYWEQFSLEELQEKGFLTPDDCCDLLCTEVIIPRMMERLAPDGEDEVELSDSLKESIKKAFRS